jgi:hypothetical protein
VLGQQEHLLKEMLAEIQQVLMAVEAAVVQVL